MDTPPSKGCVHGKCTGLLYPLCDGCKKDFSDMMIALYESLLESLDDKKEDGKE